MSGLPPLDEIRSDFALLDDWEDRYRYVIELGRMLPALDDAVRIDANKVRGCASQVWLASEIRPAPGAEPVLRFAGDSDAHIVKGLVAILLTLYSGRSVSEILSIDARAELAGLKLVEHLTPQRSNGLLSMVERIRADARAAAAA